jgi:hypothetical protein
MAPIDDALAYLESLSSGESFQYTKVADTFGVDRRALARRHKGLTQPITTKHEQQRKITPQAEAELVRYIQSLSD